MPKQLELHYYLNHYSADCTNIFTRAVILISTDSLDCREYREEDIASSDIIPQFAISYMLNDNFRFMIVTDGIYYSRVYMSGNRWWFIDAWNAEFSAPSKSQVSQYIKEYINGLLVH